MTIVSYRTIHWSAAAKWIGELTLYPLTDHILRKDLLGSKTTLEDTVTELAGDEKEMFLDLISGMLQWLPEKRKTAKELLNHLFFEQIRSDRDRY